MTSPMALRALLIGINRYPSMPLQGCVNDAQALRDVLVQRWGARAEDLRLLTDADATAAAIRRELAWLGEAEPGEEPCARLLHFSGQGTWIADEERREPSGHQEALVPFDHPASGFIPMTELWRAGDRLPAAAHLVILRDCCFSPKIRLDLSQEGRFRYLPTSVQEHLRIEAAKQEHARRGAQGPGPARPDRVIVLSACAALEAATEVTSGGLTRGAASHLLAQILGEGARRPLTYQGVVDRLTRRLRVAALPQTPQLECAEERRGELFLGLPPARQEPA